MKSRLFLLLNGVGTANYKSIPSIANFLWKKERKKERKKKKKKNKREPDMAVHKCFSEPSGFRSHFVVSCRVTRCKYR
jgi:hypothetical protein